MFERYTEKARRVIVFSRIEAGESGTKFIEDTHLLLALLREARPIFAGAFDNEPIEEIRKKFSEHFPARERVATSVDLPISHELKRILFGYAAEEADRLGTRFIGAQHLLLGLLRSTDCTAATILVEHGITLHNLRKRFKTEGEPTGPGAAFDDPHRQ